MTANMQRRLSVNIRCPHPGFGNGRISIDGTDGRTPDRYIDPASQFTYYVGSVNNYDSDRNRNLPSVL